MGKPSPPVLGYIHRLGLGLLGPRGGVDQVSEIRIGGQTAWRLEDPDPVFARNASLEAVGSFDNADTLGVSGQPTQQAVIFDGPASVAVGRRYRIAPEAGPVSDATLLSASYDDEAERTTLIFDALRANLDAEEITLLADPQQAAGTARQQASNGVLRIDEPELHGGEGGEGGSVGEVEVHLGDPGQFASAYLAHLAGRAVPAYRGVLTLVFRGIQRAGQAIEEVGGFEFQTLNNRLKKIAYRASRTQTRGDDRRPQWYPEKAAIPGGAQANDTALHIAFDVVTTQARLDIQTAAVRTLLTQI
ncbi:MAG: hypothetical protein AAGI34_19885, partial [Pseudomonadota bacterium]